jgi:hypothetical protein
MFTVHAPVSTTLMEKARASDEMIGKFAPAVAKSVMRSGIRQQKNHGTGIPVHERQSCVAGQFDSGGCALNAHQR